MENIVQQALRTVPTARQKTRDANAALGPNPLPLAKRSLGTLVDLGLSDRQIARYFKVSETKLVSLRRYYGLE